MPVSNIYPKTNILQILEANPPPSVLRCFESGTRTDLRHTLLNSVNTVYLAEKLEYWKSLYLKVYIQPT